MFDYNTTYKSETKKLICEYESYTQICNILLSQYISNNNDLLNSIFSGALELLNSERGSLIFMDENKQSFRIYYSKGIRSSLINIALPFENESILGHVYQTQKPLYYKDIKEIVKRKCRNSYNNNSAICIPLSSQNGIFGFICFNNKMGCCNYSEKDFKIAINVGIIISCLLRGVLKEDPNENNLLFVKNSINKDRDKLDILKLISEISNKIISSNDLNNLLSSIIDESTKLLGIKRCSVMLTDDSAKFLKIRAAKGLPNDVLEKVKIQIGQGISGKAAEEQKPYFITNIKKYKTINNKQSGIYENKSAIIVPLICKDKTLGVINFNNKITKKPFNDFDFFIASLIAGQASIAIYNTLLNKENISIEKSKIAMELAKHLHKKMFPQNKIENQDYTIAGTSVSCDEIGGDYYDYIKLPKNKLGIVMGDVSGHGIHAGLLMTSARAFLKSFIYQNTKLSTAFTGMNNLIKDDIEHDWFMTMFFGVIDPDNSCLNYISAGHIPALLYRSKTNSWTRLESTHIPLGVINDIPFNFSNPVKLYKDDIIIIITDGILDAINQYDMNFGINKIKHLTESVKKQNAQYIVNYLKDKVFDYQKCKDFTDDMSLIVMKYKDNLIN